MEQLGELPNYKDHFIHVPNDSQFKEIQSAFDDYYGVDSSIMDDTDVATTKAKIMKRKEDQAKKRLKDGSKNIDPDEGEPQTHKAAKDVNIMYDSFGVILALSEILIRNDGQFVS